MNVKLISVTRPVSPELSEFGPEETIVYCARVSNPENQLNLETAPRLVGYLIKNRHWSPFEMVDMCVEIKTSRAIAQQILRHRSFSFQEFSQRYAVVSGYEPPELRMRHDKGNRQGSSEEQEVSFEWYVLANVSIEASFRVYKDLIAQGVAPECARMVLPLCTATTIYMKGNIRSWIHYLDIRTDRHAQKEHREVAQAIRQIFVQQFPITSKAMGWI